jgi:hypothetical protein
MLKGRYSKADINGRYCWTILMADIKEQILLGDMNIQTPGWILKTYIVWLIL